MNKTELFIYYNGKWREIILGENISFPITYNIADVRDISKKNGSFTKTLKVPHTSENSQLFNFIFDVNNISDFDANKKVRCYVLNDTIQVFEGFFQLKNISTKDNIHFEYECVIFGDNNTLIKEIGDGYLNEMDFSELDHTLNYTNIVGSWTDDWTRGYYYPLIDYNYNWGLVELQNGIDVTDMKPAVYAKYIFDKIISDSGFTYYGNFKDNETFKNLIIPDGFDLIGRDDTNTALNRLWVGLTGSYTIEPQSSVVYSPPTSPSLNPSLPFEYTGFNPRVPLSNETLPYGDPAGEWDSVNFEYIAPNNDLVRRFSVNLRIKVYDAFQNGLTGYFTNGGYLTMRFVREFDPVTGLPYSIYSSSIFQSAPAGTRYGYPLPVMNASPTYLNEPLFPGYFHFLTIPDGLNSNITSRPFSYFSSTTRAQYNIDPIFTSDNIVATGPGYKVYEGQITTAFLERDLGNTEDPIFNKLYPGEKVWLEIDTFYNRLTLNSIFNTSGIPFEIEKAEIFTDISISEKKHKAKKKDFFTSIVKMFNLFIEPDKDNPNRLLIDTRDDYYARGVIRDWSNKLDISKNISQKVIAETGPRRYLLTHRKEENDFLNKLYLNETTEIYGQKDYLINNDFSEGVAAIETIFSPTLLSEISQISDIVIPQIKSVDNDNEPGKIYGGIRILQRGTQSISLTPNNYWKLNGVIQNSYPYSGHFNHPTNGSTDINFDVPKFLYYEGNVITNNNLFNLYYKKMLEELVDKDSRIITANFYLTPDDLNKLRFYDKIFIDSLSSGTGNYFRINKIEYDPVRSGSYKVELLKIKDIQLNLIKDEKSDGRLNPNGWGPGGTKPSTLPYSGKLSNGSVVGINNVVYDTSNVFVFGDRNKVGRLTNGFIFGSNNTIEAKSFLSAVLGGSDNFIFGAENSVILGGNNNEIGKNTTNSVIIGGSNNKIEGNVENSVIIGGNDVTLRESGRILISRPMILVSNFISAGRDEVLNAFPDNRVENFVSAGRDEVRPLGTHTIENLISAGYDFTI